MKRLILLIYILCISLLLTGCSGGGIYANFREIDLLLVVQTLGVDTAPNGDIILSIAAGRLGGEPPVRMSVRAPSISQAKNILQDYAPNQELFYSHVGYVVIGEEAAKQGLGTYLDYIARSSELRTGTPIFIVQGGTAQKLVTKAGGEKDSINDVLDALKRDLDMRGSGKAISASDIMNALSGSGGAMACLIKSAPEKDADPTAPEGSLTALPAGYAILKDGKFIDAIPDADARGINLLTGKVGVGTVDLQTGKNKASVALDGGGTKLSPRWGSDGSLAAVNVEIELNAALLETDSLEPVDDKFLATLNKALADKAKGWVNAVLEKERALKTDFAGLGKLVELSDPEKYQAMPLDFSQQLANLEFNVTATATVGRSYDLSTSRGVEGGDK